MKNTIIYVVMAISSIFMITCCSNEEVTNPDESGSASSPTAIINSPGDSVSFAAGDTITFSGTGLDQGGNPLPDNSLIWTSDQDGILGTGSFFTRDDLSENVHAVTFTVVDPENNSDSDMVTISLCSGGNSPQVRINSPSDNGFFISGETINFEGSAADSDDGILPGGSLLWTSDRDGVLGSGSSLSKNDLSENLHVVTLIATDSDGHTGTAEVSINVIPGSGLPVARISSPEDGSVYSEGHTINFSGAGLDSQDGTLDDSKLLWTSDKDGVIGTGSTLLVNDLSINSHLITLTVTDSDFNTDSDSITVTVEQPTLEILTNTIPNGNTCSPYRYQLEASGGTAPYTWELAAGSNLPTGYELTTDGVIKGMTSEVAERSFTVSCTDNYGGNVTGNLSLTVEVPSNPSIGTFYDETAEVCSAQATAFLTTLDCYVYIMLDNCPYECTTGTQFKISLVDSDGNPLDSSKYAIAYTDWADYALSIGDMWNGVSVAFTRPLHASIEGPIEVVKFGLMLLEDVNELAFSIEADPTDTEGHDQPIITQCDQDYSRVEVYGRDAALNYTE